MSVFRANNGIVIHDHGTHVSWASGFSHPFVTQALREYFQAERDEKQGLWRWPENPEYVVKMSNERELCVTHEPTFWRTNTVHFTSAESLAEFMHKKPGTYTKPWRKAARAYLKEHPIKQPWHDARDGEAWVITNKAGESVVTLCVEDFAGHTFNRFDSDSGRIFETPVNETTITHARRIWPEGDDDE